MQYVVLLGVATGMRTMTGVAVLCWCAYLGILPQHGWGQWAGSLVSVVVFSGLALGEYVGDVLPQTPSRREFLLAMSRFVFGAVVGALAWCSLGEPAVGGVVLGVMGAAIGTFGGYRARMAGARWLGRDLPVGLFESALALLFAVMGAAGVHHMLVHPSVASVVSSSVQAAS